MKFSPTIQSAMVQQPEANIANAYFNAQKQQGVRDKAALDRQKFAMDQQKFDHEMEMAPTRLEYLKNQAAVLGQSLQDKKRTRETDATNQALTEKYYALRQAGENDRADALKPRLLAAGVELVDDAPTTEKAADGYLYYTSGPDKGARVFPDVVASDSGEGQSGKGKIGTYPPAEYTVDSWTEFLETGDSSVLVFRDKNKTKVSGEKIAAGVDAAEKMPIVLRSLELLETVNTSGLNAALAKGKRFFGMDSADEGELNANLGRMVLAQLKPIFGAQFTVREGDKLESIESGMGKSTQTNIRLLRQLKQLMEVRIEIAKRRAASSDNQDALDDIEAYLSIDYSDLDEPVPSSSSTSNLTGERAINDQTGEMIELTTDGEWVPVSPGQFSGGGAQTTETPMIKPSDIDGMMQW